MKKRIFEFFYPKSESVETIKIPVDKELDPSIILELWSALQKAAQQIHYDQECIGPFITCDRLGCKTRRDILNKVKLN